MIKYFYIITFFTFIFFFMHSPVNAYNYCHLYVDDTLYDTVTMPFYFHTNTMGWEFDISNMPHAIYSSSSAYITTPTECERIKVKPIKNNIDTFETFNITFYDYTDTPYDKEYSNEKRFTNSVFTNSKTTIKGIFSLDDLQAPVFSNYLEKYTSNIAFPIDVKDIIKSINVYDKRDGNLKDSIEIIYDSYSENKYTPGNYLLILEVKDYSNNTASLTLNIETIDTSPPSIEGINYYKSFLSNPLEINEIKDNIQVFDNSKVDLSQTLNIYEENYLSNKNIPGTYFINFYATDKSNNISKIFTVTIEVIDDLKPIINGNNYYTTSISNPLPIENIRLSLKATDNDTNISSSIYVLDDKYTPNIHTIGEKNIYFQVMDKDGNISDPYEVTINIVDDITPSIYGLNNFTSYLSNPLSITYLKQQLSAIDNYDGDISHLLTIIDDSYSSNINNTGIHYITFQVEDKSLNTSSPFTISIENIDDVAPIIKGPLILKYEFSNKPTLNELLYNFEAIDNVNGVCDLVVEYDTYSSSSTIGTYYISLYSIDSSNNKSSPYKIQIEIKDILINTNELTLLLPTSTLYTIEEITALINLNKEYTITSDTYTDNYLNEGTYEIIYKIDDYNNINLTITTYSLNKETTTTTTKAQKKETFLTKIKSFFQKIITKIKSFFSKLNIFLYFYKY